MKNLKKILCVVLVCVFGCLSCCVEVSAFFSNTHFYLGEKIFGQICKLPENEKEELLKSLGYSVEETKAISPVLSTLKEGKRAFLSGMFLADIGKFRFDKECSTQSDSEEFAKVMWSYAETPIEKWFALGWWLHALQDGQTNAFLSDVFGETSDYSKYIFNCSLLDHYFRSKYYCINYNEFLDMFNFEKVSTDIGMECLFKVINVSKDKMEFLAKSRIRKNSWPYYERDLVICGNLIKKVYRYYGLDKLSYYDIYYQAGFAVGVSMAAIPFIRDFIYKNGLPEDVAQKVEAKSDELVNMCVPKIRDVLSTVA